MIFEDIGQIEHETVSIHVSFLEIHKEIAFDLLGPIMAKGGRKSKEVRQITINSYLVCLHVSIY